VINSIDVRKLLRLVDVGDLSGLRSYLLAEIGRVNAAGADLAILAANTPHIVFDALAGKSPLPLIGIVSAIRDRAKALGLKRVGLLGTRFTMSGGFFERVFTPSAIQLAVPTEDEQTYLHEKYTQELLRNIFTPQTRDGVVRIITRLLSLPLLNTTHIHAQAAVDAIWP